MRFDAWSFVFLLALLPALVALYAYGFRRRRVALAALVAGDLAPRVWPVVSSWHRWGRALCLIGATTSLIVALMQPQWGRGEQGLPLRGRDLVIVLDVSLSMLAEDAPPDRLSQAQAAVRSLVAAVEGDGGHRLGLLTFAGRADVQCPLTRDYALFLSRLDAVEVASVARRGSAIGDALLRILSRFDALEPAYTDLILLSDGEDHDGQPLEAARLLAAQGFTLHTVGIGDPDAEAPIPIAQGEGGHLVYDGQEVRTRMRRGLLTAMAEATGGAYLGAADGLVRLDRLYREQIASKPRREIAGRAEPRLGDRFPIFLALAILLLAGEMLMREPRRAKI